MHPRGTLHVLRGAVPLAVALVAAVVVVRRPAAPHVGASVGPLDVWRAALAGLAVAGRVALAAVRRDPAPRAVAGAVAGAAAPLLCGAAALAEARKALREHGATRAAWALVAAGAAWDAVALRRRRAAPGAGWADVAAAAVAVVACASYGAFNAAARRRRKPALAAAAAAGDYALLEEDDATPTSPEDDAGLASTVSFAWMSPLLAVGFRRPLEAPDLFPLARADQPEAVAARLRRALGGGARHKKRPLGAALARAFGPYFLVGGCYKLVYDTTQLAVPVLLSRLLKAMTAARLGERGAASAAPSYRIAAVMVANAVLATCVLHQYFQRTYRTGMRLKSAAISLVFDKAMVARRETAPKDGGGKAAADGDAAAAPPPQADITNLMSVDAQRLQDNMTYLFTVVSALYQISVTLYLLYGQLGPSAYGGLGVMLAFMPVSKKLVETVRDYQKKVLEFKDRRIKLQAEAFGGMKIVKLYGWEPPLGAELKRLREAELAALWKYKLAQVVNRVCFAIVPTLVSVVTFAIYVGVAGRNLDVARVYTTLALFNVLRFPLIMAPRALGGAVEASLSVGRLAAFLDSDEVTPLAPLSAARSPLAPSTAPVYAAGAAVAWPGGAPLLAGLDFALQRGTLTAVVGETGSGKSGLLAALLGECAVERGEMGVEGAVAYAAQAAWIQNATLRANVLFGAPLDPARYADALRRCALGADLAALADGDATEIGEKGLTLSGGQKQRVALARAYYADADVYLLDDCLSAVDAHVAAHLFEHLILHLRDRGKTVVLVTHNLSTLRRCDAVVALGADRRLAYAGAPDGFLALGAADPAAHPLAALAAAAVPKTASHDNLAALADAEAAAAVAPAPAPVPAAPLTAAEHRTRGVVSNQTRLAYIAATGGAAAAVFVVVAQVVYQASTVVGSWWLGYWSAQAHIGASEGLEVYVSLSLLAVCLSAVSMYVASRLGQAAARALHDRMLDGLLRAPMAFFDATPLGRLLNLFSKDLYTIDEELPVTLAMWLSVATTCLATLGTIAVATPWFLGACAPLGVLYFGTMKYFIPSVRELKRLDATSRSPVFSAFAEALDGASTIRAFRAADRFSADQAAKLRRNLRAYFLGTCCNRWLAVRLEMIGTATTGCAAFLAIATGTEPYLAGLSLTYALSVTQSLNWFVRTNADLENNSVAVERVVACAAVAAEADGHAAAPPAWPSAGALAIRNLELRYRPDLPRVLKGLSLDVAGGTKLALVGRTGSGKSSFLLALLRLAPPATGSSILIDGVDALAVKLADLRTRISMIPQDPVLFSGSVRFNVDPFASAPDADVRAALRAAELARRLPADALGARVEEGGRNFSLGERQLLCLARACLRKSKLLLLDEATSAVDVALDGAVQAAIRTHFRDSTVVCIAHRINTIADYDRVLVLDDGAVVEDGAPAVLAADPASHYARLASAHDEGV